MSRPCISKLLDNKEVFPIGDNIGDPGGVCGDGGVPGGAVLLAGDICTIGKENIFRPCLDLDSSGKSSITFSFTSFSFELYSFSVIISVSKFPMSSIAFSSCSHFL